MNEFVFAPSYSHLPQGLRLFGYIIRSSPNEDHHRSVASATQKPPSDWKRPKGRPSHTWLRAIEAELKPLNEYQPLACMEEGNQSGDLAISGGHSNTQEEYATRRRRRRSKYTSVCGYMTAVASDYRLSGQNYP